MLFHHGPKAERKGKAYIGMVAKQKEKHAKGEAYLKMVAKKEKLRIAKPQLLSQVRSNDAEFEAICKSMTVCESC